MREGYETVIDRDVLVAGKLLEINNGEFVISSGSKTFSVNKDKVKFVEVEQEEKPIVPQLLVDYLNDKGLWDGGIFDILLSISRNYRNPVRDFKYESLYEWLFLGKEYKERQKIFATLLLNGPGSVEVVPTTERYKISMPSLEKDKAILHFIPCENRYFFDEDKNLNLRSDSRYHTKDNLERAGLGSIFENPLFKVEKVE